jgi:putative transposase
MSILYEIAATTRQAHHRLRRQLLEREDEYLLLVAILCEERQKHPAMSLKKLYHRIAPGFIGRDAFIDFCMENGFETVFLYKKPQLTRSSDLRSYPNRLYDATLTDINQVWVSDITYLKVDGKWCYITLIMDLYSRKIIGHHAAPNLFATANIQALEMAFKHRNCFDFKNKLIHHSDRGTQYRSLAYTQLLDNANVQISMAYSCFDNPYIESVNNIIKGEYLKHRCIKSMKDLQMHLEKDIRLYNEERPHGQLKMKTPVQFERDISNIPISQRTLLNVYTDKSKKHKLLFIEPDYQQLRLDF